MILFSFYFCQKEQRKKSTNMPTTWQSFCHPNKSVFYFCFASSFVLLFCCILFLFLRQSLLYPVRSCYWPTHKRFPVVSVFPRVNIQLVNKFIRCAACYVCSPLSLTLNFQVLLNFVVRQSSDDKTRPFLLQDTKTLWFPLPCLRHLPTLCLVRDLPSSAGRMVTAGELVKQYLSSFSFVVNLKFFFSSSTTLL